METQRLKIATLLRAGHTTPDIVKILKVDRNTVYRVRKRIENEETLKYRSRPPKTPKLTPEAAKKAFQANPTMSMSELAKKKGVDRRTVANAVKAAGGRSRKFDEKPLLTQRQQEVRLQRCELILNDLKHHGNRVIFFSDEKTFTVDPVINKQNDRVVCFEDTPKEVYQVTRTKHPASVMMLGVVASTGEKMPPIWFETGYRLTAADYLEILKNKVLP